MTSKELIAAFINKVVEGDPTAKQAFSAYCDAKAIELKEAAQKKVVFESFKNNLMESLGGSPISMDGDFITVNGKRVGRVETDMNDFDSGINFISVEGDFSKEFNTAEELFTFISTKYLGEA